MVTSGIRRTLSHMLERHFPDRRVFLRSDTDTRFIRLSPSTQLIALTGTTLLVGWTIVASAILFMDSLGAGDIRQQAAREQAMYEARLSAIAAERDERTMALEAAHARFAAAMDEISAMQSSLLASEEHLRELEAGIEIMQATLARTLRERDAATSQLAAVDAVGALAPGAADPVGGATIDAMAEALRLTAAERDRVAEIAAEAHARIDDMEFEAQLAAERNDRVFGQLEQAVAVSMEPLEKVFETVGLSPESLIAQVRAARTPVPAFAPVRLSTSGTPDPDAERASAILDGMERIDLYRQAAEKTPLSLPLRTAFRHTSGFGMRWGRMHAGTDMAGAYGSPVLATADGVVSQAGWESGYGQMVTVRHDFGFETRYAHLSEIRVSVGERVSRGDRVGDMGNSGRSTGTHLHYEVRVGGNPVDPMRFIRAASNVF
jgi:murein DD-endopeptidase MepM/ murein hydrolase activator NlpD